MFLNRKPKQSTTAVNPKAVSVTEAQDRIQELLGSEYLVSVPEQNPVNIGHEVLYRAQIITVATGEVRHLHISVPDMPGPGDDVLEGVKLKDIAFPINPFNSVIHIDEAVNGRAS